MMRRLGALVVVLLAVAGFQIVAAPVASADARPFFQLPVNCGERWRLSTYPGHGKYEIDFFPESAPTEGRPVRASAAGVASEVKYGESGGYQVRVNHGGGWATLYIHLQAGSTTVRNGDRVVAGQQIARVGRTGSGAGSSAHLHYEQQRWDDATDWWKPTQAFFNGVQSKISDDDAVHIEWLTSFNCQARMISGGNGYLYRVGTDGLLRAYHHDGWATGTSDWRDLGVVGTDWGSFVHIVADDNRIYGINRAGQLRWYELDFATKQWSPGSGDVVGVGWFFKRVFSGGNGEFYAITDSGELKWYKRTHPDTNQVGWAPDAGKVIGSSWQGFQHITMQDGVIYAVDGDFDVRWYRFPGHTTGETGWTEGSGRTVRTGWRYPSIGASGSGVLHVVTFNGDLWWYDHQDFTAGGATWSPAKQVGSGWL